MIGESDPPPSAIMNPAKPTTSCHLPIGTVHPSPAWAQYAGEVLTKHRVPPEDYLVYPLEDSNGRGGADHWGASWSCCWGWVDVAPSLTHPWLCPIIKNSGNPIINSSPVDGDRARVADRVAILFALTLTPPSPIIPCSSEPRQLISRGDQWWYVGFNSPGRYI